MEIRDELNPGMYWIFDKQTCTTGTTKLKSVVVNLWWYDILLNSTI